MAFAHGPSALVELDIRPAQQHGAERLAAFHQVMQIGSRSIVPPGQALFSVERARSSA